jgi:hypothetical protein
MPAHANDTPAADRDLADEIRGLRDLLGVVRLAADVLASTCWYLDGCRTGGGRSSARFTASPTTSHRTGPRPVSCSNRCCGPPTMSSMDAKRKRWSNRCVPRWHACRVRSGSPEPPAGTLPARLREAADGWEAIVVDTFVDPRIGPWAEDVCRLLLAATVAIEPQLDAGPPAPPASG